VGQVSCSELDVYKYINYNTRSWFTKTVPFRLNPHRQLQVVEYRPTVRYSHDVLGMLYIGIKPMLHTVNSNILALIVPVRLT